MSTPRLLQKENIPFTVVVEPQDAINYSKAIGENNTLILPENDRGLSYSRREIKRHAIENGQEFFWQMDDDVISFYRREGNKNIRSPILPIIKDAEMFISHFTNIKAVGIGISTYAFAQKQGIAFNRQVCTVGCFDAKVDIWWRDNTIEDTDYSLQILSAGYCTAVFNKMLHLSAPTMSQDGGMTTKEWGNNGKERLSNRMMVLWPDFFLITNRNGKKGIRPRPHAWDRFKQVPISR